MANFIFTAPNIRTIIQFYCTRKEDEEEEEDADEDREVEVPGPATYTYLSRCSWRDQKGRARRFYNSFFYVFLI